jgi:hypothetical protein
MVNIIQPTQRTSITYNVDSGEIDGGIDVPDSIEQLAGKVGIVDAINTINDESTQTDHNLRDMYNIDGQHTDGHNNQPQYEDYPPDHNEHYQEEPPKKKPQKKKNKTADQRIRELSYHNVQVQNEKEELERELKRTRDEHAASILAFEKQKIAHDIQRVSDIMMQAKEEDETKTYVDANRVLHTLITKESENDHALNSLKQQYESYGYVDPNQEAYRKEADDRFLALSDSKELNSDAYSEWLRENPFYNPYDMENYDADLAEDVHHIKKNFNKFLKGKRNGNYIGTEDYYHELNAIINTKLFGDYQSNTHGNYNPNQSNQGYYQQENQDMARHVVQIDPNYDQSLKGAVPEGQNRMHGQYPDPETYSPPMPPQRPPQQQYQQQYQAPSPQNHYSQPARNVMPVNRAGYSSQYGQNELPTLNSDQRKIALSIPMYEQNGRPLSESERIYEYSRSLADMNRRR